MNGKLSAGLYRSTTLSFKFSLATDTLMKIAVVTGAGSGIGRAIALKFASDGLKVVNFDRDKDSGVETQSLIEQAGGSCDFIECDVSDTQSVENAFDQLDRLDVLVNNAGIASIGNVETTSPEELDRLYSVNVKGVYHCLHFGVPKMKTNGGGAILTLASIASKVGIADRFAYSMTKGAALTMTLSVARDYIDAGIRANCICPARVHTPFVDGYLEKNYPPEERESMFKTLSQYQPIGRMGQPEEIAELAAFICSDRAKFMTGVAFDIDGGLTQLR